MERLTKRTEAGVANLHYPQSCFYPDGTKDQVAVSAYRQKAIDRLAAYEDTGLTPERVAEFSQAEHDGRLVAHLPGEKVYDRFGNPWIIESAEIHLMSGKMKQLFRCGHPGTDDYYSMYEDEILTKEEAEAALKKKKEENI